MSGRRVTGNAIRRGFMSWGQSREVRIVLVREYQVCHKDWGVRVSGSVRRSMCSVNLMHQDERNVPGDSF